MKLKLSELNPNPFKKHINDGKLNQSRIEILKESIDHGTLPEYFTARKNNGKYELTSGHHRASALKTVKGNSYEVEVGVVDFTDEQMLIDMVRENMTQRDTDYHDTSESVVLARNWLQSGETDVKQFNSHLSDGRKAPPQNQPQPDSYRSIATFLSKNGKTVSYATVKNYLDVRDKLSPKLFEKIKKLSHATAEHKEDQVVGVRIALKLATFDDYNEQEDLFDALKDSKEQHGNLQTKNLTTYRNAPDEIKEQVRQGKLDIADVEEAIIILTRDDEYDEEILYFTPNFGSQVKAFDNDVIKLEKQVALFNRIFTDNRFQEKYANLKTKEKKVFDESIFSIHNRIKKCYDQVEEFMEQLPDGKKKGEIGNDILPK